MTGGDRDTDAGKLKVFISYSRKDVDFADDLELFLDTRGFDPVIDRHDIDHNDDWQARLYELIHGCDVVVFVLTETSAASPICKWEVDEAAKLGKRRLVVTPGPLPAGVAPPEALGAANWIHCWRNPAVPDSSLAKGKKELERALKTDVVWLRERTRLMEQAAAWSARGAAVDSPLLLRGDVLLEAQDWARKTPKDETLPDTVAAFLNASEAHEARLKAETEAGLAEKQAALMKAAAASRRVRRVSMIGGLVAAVLLAVAATAGWIALTVRDEAARVAAAAADAQREAENQKALADRYLTDARTQGELARTKTEEANALQTEAELQAQLAAANLSEAERQGYLAAEGLSNQMAQLADDIAANGAHERAVLMALYAASPAKGSEAVREFGEQRGFRLARTSLASASTDMRLIQLIRESDGPLSSAAFSRDAKQILTATNNVARLWDAVAGSPVHVLRGHHRRIQSVDFSPNGARVLTASDDGTAKIWETATGKELLTLVGHTDSVQSAAFSPDGSRIVTASRDKTVRIWETKTGIQLRVLKGHESIIYDAAFSHDGNRVATASSDGTARVWDAWTGVSLLTVKGNVESAQFSPDDARILCASSNGTAQIWDATTGEIVLVLRGHEGSLYSAVFSNDGARIVTTSSDETARVWDARTGAALLVFRGHEHRIWTGEFSSDGTKVLTASDDGTARIWDAETSAAITLRHATEVSTASFSLNSKLVVTASQYDAQIWNALTGAPLLSLKGHRDFIHSASFSPDSSRVVTASGNMFSEMFLSGSSTPQNDAVRIWSAATGELLTTVANRDKWAKSAAFSSDGARIVTTFGEGATQVWDSVSGVLLITMSGPDKRAQSSSFSSDGTQIIAAFSDGMARIWNSKTGNLISIVRGDGREMKSAIFAPSGKRILTVSYDTAYIWSTRTGALLLSLQTSGTPARSATRGKERLAFGLRTDSIVSASFSNDDKFVVTAAGNQASVWDAEVGKKVMSISGAGSSFNSAAFSPDGLRVITASKDGAARIWEVPEIVRASAKRQVAIACQRLKQAGAPLAFATAEVATYPVLRAIPEDTANPGFLVSPCRGILPDAAFVKAE